jgi:hypothetical protein
MVGGRAGRHPVAALLTMIALSTAGLAACTDDDTPPQQSSTAAPSPSLSATSPPASPTATPPSAPKAKPTPKSAEAFVKYFWDVHNYAYATLDLEEFKSISEPQCTFCSSTIKDIEALKDSRSVVEGSAVRLWVAAAPPAKIGTRVLVATVVSQSPGREIAPDGSIKSFPGMTKRSSSVALSWIDQRWLVHDISINKPGSTS